MTSPSSSSKNNLRAPIPEENQKIVKKWENWSKFWNFSFQLPNKISGNRKLFKIILISINEKWKEIQVGDNFEKIA